MVRYIVIYSICAIATSACVAKPPQVPMPVPGDEPVAIRLVDLRGAPSLELAQPAIEESPTPAEPTRLPKASASDSTARLSLVSLETIALSNSPAVAQALARVEALRGKWVQVGLPPNPTIGYLGGEIGNEDSAGQHGGFVGQSFITASKLQRNRDVVASEICVAEQQLAAMHQKIRTDVRKGYYDALLAQRRLELSEELVRISGEAVEASEALLRAEEIPMVGLLQSKIQQKHATLFAQTAQNQMQQAWRSLSAIVGEEQLPQQPLEGEVSEIPESLDWNHQLDRLHHRSPEVAIALAELERSRRALCRATVEAVPDIRTQFSVQYDDATDDTFMGVQVSLPLPLWDRNQGGICQSQAEVRQAKQNVERVRLSLSQRLADAFRSYADSTVTAENYKDEILPLAAKAFALVREGYQQGEVGYLDLLAAQQTFSRTNLAYLDTLDTLWRSYLQIEGLLLEGSLE